MDLSGSPRHSVEPHSPHYFPKPEAYNGTHKVLPVKEVP